MTALKYTLEKDGVSLQSLDKYVECITAMNDLIAEFGQFAAMDVNSLQQIKAKWMNTDSNLATKTFAEIFTDTKMGNS